MKAKKPSPLEAARLAKAKAAKGGKTEKKAAKKKAALPMWKAPEDFKPFFVTVAMRTDKDGLLSSSIKATRYQGRYDPQAEDKKKFDMSAYDPKTVNGILSRFAMTTFVTNVAKRLPANTTFQVLLRVNKKSSKDDKAKDGTIAVGFKGLDIAVMSKKTGRLKLEALDKKDPMYRKFRKASRILPAAFKEVQMPPKRSRGANKKGASDE